MAAVSHYRIEFRNSSDDSLLRTVDNIPEPRLTYTNEQNAADHGGTPSRSVKVRLFTVDDLGGVSEPDEITISNPAPAAPASVSITQVGNAVDIQPELSSDPDIAGMRVWMGTSSGFTPGPGNLIYDGNSTRAVIPLSTGGTRYFRIAFFDTFSKEGLNVSGEESFSFVTQPIRDEIPPANPTAFSATALFSGAQLSWVNPADDDLAHTEVWISTTNNIADADMVQSVAAPATTISTSGQTAGSTFYYWIRSVDVWDNKSAFVGPESATVRRLVSDEIGDAIINANKLASNAVTAGKLANDAVTASKILDGAVDTAKIADAAIEAAKLGNDAVTAGKIAAGAVTGAKLASGAVSIAKFASGLRPVEIVSSLPSIGNVVGRTVVLTTDQKLYRWNGSAWTASVAAGDISGTIAAAQIAALEASKITGQLTNAQLADIAATKITGQLTNSQINDIAAAKLTGQITGTQITDGAISTGKLAAGSVTTAKLVAGAVTASEIASDAITAAKIQSGAITTAKLAAGAVTAATIAAGTITAAQIQSGTITSAQIAAGTIQAGDIASNTITASQIAANAITASELSANAVTAGKIAAGAVTADEIAANAITASKLAVTGSADVQSYDPTFQDPEFWPENNAQIVTVSDGYRGTSVLRADAYESLDETHGDQYRYPIDPNKVYEVEAAVRRPYGDGKFYGVIRFYDEAGAPINSSNATGSWGTYSNNWYSPAGVQPGASWAVYTMKMGPGQEANIPTNAVSFSVGMLINYAPTVSSRMECGFFGVRQLVDGELIVDGAVVADKIAANAITSEKITANAITSAKIATGAITAGKIAANTITAGQIAANAIGVSELAADSVTTAKILAGAVTASEIASNAVTAAKIAAGSVSADKITSNAVTAAKILAGAVSTDKLAAASVVADKIGSAAITTDKLAANAITASKIGAGIIEGSMINSATAINVGTGGALASGLFDRAALLGEGTNSNPVRIHAGHVSPTESPFQVDREGNVIARRLTILTPDGSSVWFDTDLGFSELARAQILAQSSPRTDFLAETESTNTDFISFALVDTVNVTATAKVSSNGLSITQDWQYGQNEPGNVFPTQLSINIETAPAGGAYSDRVTKTYTKITSGSPGANEYLVEVTKQAPSQVTFIDDGVQPPQQVTYNVPGWKTERIVSPGTLSATTTNSFTGDADGETYEVRAVLSASGVNPSLLGFDSKARTIELSTPAKNFVLDLALVQGEGNAQQLQGLEPGDFWRKSELTTPLDVGTNGILPNRTISTVNDSVTNGAFAIPAGFIYSNANSGHLRVLIGQTTSGGDIQIGQGGTSIIGGINLLPGVSGQAKVNGNRIIDASGGQINGTLSFGSTTRQMINLWGTQYGIGVQSNTQYFRSGFDFAWFTGGSHSDARRDPGTGGTRVMHYTGGVFYVHDQAVATQSWVNSQGFLTSVGNISASQVTSGTLSHERVREIDVFDSRNDAIVDPLPSEIGDRRFRMDFRISGSPTSNWRSVLSTTGWDDGTYATHQLSFNATNSVNAANTDLYHRTGMSNSWNPWRKIWDDGNFNPDSRPASSITSGTFATARIPTTEGATGSTIPIRNASGDIFARLFRSTYPSQSGTPATSADIAFRNNDSSDNYIRFMDGGAFIGWLNNQSGTLADARIPTLAISKISGLQSALDGKRGTTDNSFSGGVTFAGAGGNTHFNWGGNGAAYVSYGDFIQFRYYNGSAYSATAAITNSQADFYVTLKQSGNNVWHAGNFSPNDKLNTSGGTISGTLGVTGSQTYFTGSRRLYHSYNNDRTLWAPRLNDDSNWNWGREFGFDFVNNRWYTDGDHFAGGFVATGRIQTDAFVQTSEIRTNNGTQLVLVAGESSGYTGLTAERVYVAAEGGFQVNSSPDNWASGWAGRNPETIINDSAGNSYFGGEVVFRTSGSTVGVKLANWSSNHPGLLDDTGRYLIMQARSSGHTYVGAKAGGNVYIRRNNNDSTNQMWIDSTAAHANNHFFVGGDLRANGGYYVGRYYNDNSRPESSVPTNWASGHYITPLYDAKATGYPVRFGTLMTAKDGTGNATTQIAMSWHNEDINSPLWFRANRDGDNNWSHIPWQQILTMRENGYVYINGKEAFRTHDSWLRINNGGSFTSGVYFGNSRVRTDNEFTLNDDRYLRDGSSLSWRLQNANGYVDIGPQNSSYCHFNTDRAQFYFNKEIEASGGFQCYNTSTYLHPDALRVAGTYHLGNRKHEAASYSFTGGTDTAWKKIAEVSLTTGAYRGASFVVKYINTNGNWGNTVNWEEQTYYVACRRSGPSQDDSNDASVQGPEAGRVRVVKTSTGNYEIQARQYINYRDIDVTIQQVSENGGDTVTYPSGTTPPNGSTTGTVYEPTGAGLKGQLDAVTFVGNLGQVSDARRKTEVRDLETGFLDKIDAKRYLHNDIEEIGFLAQDFLNNGLPELVGDRNGEYSLDYGRVSAVLWAELKRERKRNDELERRLERLEALL